MFKLDTEKALLDAFRPKDRSVVEVSADLTFPLFVRNYVAWTHPAGGRVFLVFSVPGGVPTGIAFSTNGGGPPVPSLCEWCHSPGLGTKVGLLAARVTGQRTAGVHVCVDLSCQQNLEDEADRSGRSVLPAWSAMMERIARFATEGLRIDLSGAGR